MRDPIRLYYHAGYYARRNPIATIRSLRRYGTFFTPVYNFGDQISKAVVSGLAGCEAIYASPGSKKKFIAVGSVLGAAKAGDTVWGAGLMREEHADFVPPGSSVDIRAVRGPETRRALMSKGVECPEIYGDPAMLLPLVFQPRRKVKYALGVVPHLSHYEEVQRLFAGQDVLMISPRMPWMSVVERLCACEQIVSSSLHGVILAEAYGVPALAMRHKDWLRGSDFKFVDYFRSTGRELDFIDSEAALDLVGLRRRIANSAPPRADLRALLDAFPWLDAEPDFGARLDAHLEFLEKTQDH